MPPVPQRERFEVTQVSENNGDEGLLRRALSNLDCAIKESGILDRVYDPLNKPLPPLPLQEEGFNRVVDPERRCGSDPSRLFI
jgi:hypothetical protein